MYRFNNYSTDVRSDDPHPQPSVLSKNDHIYWSCVYVRAAGAPGGHKKYSVSELYLYLRVCTARESVWFAWITVYEVTRQNPTRLQSRNPNNTVASGTFRAFAGSFGSYVRHTGYNAKVAVSKLHPALRPSLRQPRRPTFTKPSVSNLMTTSHPPDTMV